MADTDASPPAGGAEPLIPKSRLDEVSARLRQKEDELAIKDRLYLENLQRERAQAQPRQARELTPEDTGFDPDTHQKVVKTARIIADQMLTQERQMLGQQIGILSARTEKAELLATHGAEKAKHIPEIERRQQEHYQRTGSFMPADLALRLIEGEEKDARIRALEAKLAGIEVPGAKPHAEAAAPPAPQPTPQGGVPSAAGTRHIPGGAPSATVTPSPAGTAYGDLSVAEMEARLEEQFKAGARL